jgi:hypothetical protein
MLNFQQAIAKQYPIPHDTADAEIVFNKELKSVFWSEGAQKAFGHQAETSLLLLEFLSVNTFFLNYIYQEFTYSSSYQFYRFNAGGPVVLFTRDRRSIQATVTICPLRIEEELYLILFLRIIEAASPEYVPKAEISGVLGQGIAGFTWWISLNLRQKIGVISGLILLVLSMALLRPESTTKLIQEIKPNKSKSEEPPAGKIQIYQDGTERKLHIQ